MDLEVWTLEGTELKGIQGSDLHDGISDFGGNASMHSGMYLVTSAVLWYSQKALHCQARGTMLLAALVFRRTCQTMFCS